MPYEIVMPRLGWNMEEGTLVEWLKVDGEEISKGQMVCTIEGDKAATDVESFETGILKIPDASPSPGQTVPVGALLGFIVSEAELETFDPNADLRHDGSGKSIAAGIAEGEERDPGPTGHQEEGTEPGHDPTGRALDGSRATVPTVGAVTGTLREREVPAISPRARRVAESAGIDWRSLKGSGRSGRIVERDVLEAAGQPGQLRRRESAMDGPESKAGPSH